MRRDQLEHVIRAVGAILGETRLVILGSQSILGKYPTGLPPEATFSVEVDVLPFDDLEGRKADLIDGTIGEGSLFHETFGIYAQGVGEKTARLPDGWRERLIPVQNANTMGVTGYCLEPHDLLISKYLAGRPKDLAFCEAVVRAGLVREDVLVDRLRHTSCTPEEARRVLAAIRRHFRDRGERQDREADPGRDR
ncbi:MAG: hypothetical protein K6U79_03345 [Firmicutes bacterium]|nr:hypothetical protein [Bacillota bacterium]